MTELDRKDPRVRAKMLELLAAYRFIAFQKAQKVLNDIHEEELNELTEEALRGILKEHNQEGLLDASS